MKRMNFFSRVRPSNNFVSIFRTDVERLRKIIAKREFPAMNYSYGRSGMSEETFKHLVKCQLTTRLIDLSGNALVKDGKGFFRINNMGHEGLAAIACHLNLQDPKLLHYRSGAAYVEWLIRSNQDPVRDILRSITGSQYAFSGGRHKVFGNSQANVIPQTSTIASQIPKAVGLSFAIQNARETDTIGRFDNDSLVFCSFGDGSFNHGSAQDAFNMAEWHRFSGSRLPLLFVCENNGVSISTKNPPGYIESVMSHRSGIHYFKSNGSNILDVFQKAKFATDIARNAGEPVFLDVKTTRLSSHYAEHLFTEDGTADPLIQTMALAVDSGIFSIEQIDCLLAELADETQIAMQEVIAEPKLEQIDEQNQLTPVNIVKCSASQESGTLKKQRQFTEKPLTLAETINRTLIETMERHGNAVVMGDDVANSAGGVYGTTKGLEELFGKNRVFNTPIAETFLLSMAQMMGLNGLLPIVEIRHLAYLHNAIDQIRGEASTTSWLSQGKFSSPLLLRIPGLGYHTFGGNFHNDSSIAALRDIPGVIIACPSNAHDAAGMLRTCVNLVNVHKRIVVYIEPISLYNVADLHDVDDRELLSSYTNGYIELNELGIYGNSSHLTILSYGNGLPLALKAAKDIERQKDVSVQVVDIRWLKPLPMQQICQVIKDTPNVLIVDEGRKTASVSEEIYTQICEMTGSAHSIYRLTAKDAFVPMGKSALSVFPSKEQIADFAVNILDQVHDVSDSLRFTR